MVQKVTASVSDELYERLQAVKGLFNISRVCQEALERQITMEELRAKETAGDEQASIERLRQQREEINAKYEQQGHEDGLAHASRLDYESLVAIAHGEGDFWNQYSDWYDTFELSAREYSDDNLFDRARYGEGWLEGVREWWEANKEQIES